VTSTPRFLQAVVPYSGRGLQEPAPLDPSLRYEVPDGAVAQAVYFRGGNSGGDLVCVTLVRDGVPMRYFPIGARADCHVPLRVVEDLEAGTVLELHLAAPDGAAGFAVIDFGLMEV
jgi:assimilatory nitrate reductase catalytic subunit